MDRIEKVSAQLAKGLFTVPGSIKEELATNPFMRTRSSKEIQDKVGESDPIRLMDSLRSLKNNF
jgi:hypothetical protein